MHNSENVIKLSYADSGFVAVFQSLSLHDEVKSVTLLEHSVSKLPPDFPAIQNFSAIQKSIVETNSQGSQKLSVFGSSAKMEGTVERKKKQVFVLNAKNSNNFKRKTNYPPCLLCKRKHTLCFCAAFKEGMPLSEKIYS